MQQTLILIKPDGVQRRLVGSIMGRFEQKGLRLAGLKLVRPSRDLAEKHYAVLQRREALFMSRYCSSSLAAPRWPWSGRGAKRCWWAAYPYWCHGTGTAPPPATIRGDFALSVQNNLVHGSDSPENAKMEIELWFGAGELVSYPSTDREWIG